MNGRSGTGMACKEKRKNHICVGQKDVESHDHSSNEGTEKYILNHPIRTNG